jgi:hypothetical protein
VSRESKETRQIREAFIDGFLSAKGGDGDRHRAEAERAWRNENETGHPAQEQQT